ncbi:MAG: CoA ester lyase [Hyphomonadaceae bacterium]
MPLVPAWKSLLFAPADNEALCAKAAASRADAIILDLEDGVGEAAKPRARSALPAAAAALRAAGRGVAVRINGSPELARADLEACAATQPDAVLAPKVEGVADLDALAAMLAGDVGIVAMIESASAIHALAPIAAHARVVGLALGTEDFSVSLGVAPTVDALDLPARLVAIAAAPRRLMALAAPISIAAFRDKEAYAVALQLAARFGATGAICIHPSQAEAANAAFQPSEAECANARAVLDAWSAAQAAGLSVTSLDGRMIDLPVAEQAKRALAKAGR